MFALLLCQVKILPSIFELHFFILLVSSCSSEHTQCANQFFCVTSRGMLYMLSTAI